MLYGSRSFTESALGQDRLLLLCKYIASLRLKKHIFSHQNVYWVPVKNALHKKLDLRNSCVTKVDSVSRIAG